MVRAEVIRTGRGFPNLRAQAGVILSGRGVKAKAVARTHTDREERQQQQGLQGSEGSPRSNGSNRRANKSTCRG